MISRNTEYLEPSFACSCLYMTLLITVFLSECPVPLFPCPLTLEASSPGSFFSKNLQNLFNLRELEAPYVPQYEQQVSVDDHEGGADHGVLPPVADHPQSAGPDEQHEGQPAVVGDAPGFQGGKARKRGSQYMVQSPLC